MTNVYDLLWVEKYRPKKLSELILPENYRKQFEKYIKDKMIPHLLFYGNCGTGKTCLANIIVDNIIESNDDILELNGSSSTGVDMVRDLIQDFLSVPSFSDTGLKIVRIEEADYLSLNAQAALRLMMEELHENGRFIFTINYPHKIIKELHSRFQSYEFKQLPKNYIIDFAKNILKKEKIKFDADLVENIVNNFYPDVRKTIGTIQSSIIDNELVFENREDSEEKVLNYIYNCVKNISKNKNVSEEKCKDNLLELLNTVEIDYKTFYEKGVMSDLPFWVCHKISIAANNHVTALSPFLNFMGMYFDIIDYAKKMKE